MKTVNIRPSADSVIQILLKHCTVDCKHCPVFDLCWRVTPHQD